MMIELSNETSESIKRDGCYSSTDFLSEDICDKIVSEIKSTIKNVNLYLTKEHGHFIVANHTQKREVPGKLGDYPKPVIVTRGLNGFDKNMTEIFNAQKLFSLPVQEIDSFVNQTVQKMGFSKAKTEYSVYINKKVEDIRGFHRDVDVNGSKQLLKLFVYLTDVPDYTYGPHSYIPGTHNIEKCKEFANQLVGNYTDPDEYDFDLLPKVFTGKRGTMIMTTQSGMHRGLPQIQNKERIILVCKIRPE